MGRRAAELDLGFGDLFDVLLARKWTVIGIAIVVMAASIFSAARQETMYSSKASVLLASSTQSSVEAQQLLATQKQLADSRDVANIVLHDLHRTDSADHLLAGLSVSVPLNTQLIEFRYNVEEPCRGATGGAGFVEAYIKYQGQLLDGLVRVVAVDRTCGGFAAVAAREAQADAARTTDPAMRPLRKPGLTHWRRRSSWSNISGRRSFRRR